ncbi:MAG: peptidylprolyl isomerase [Ignavibacteria bacterium]|nr:peptidylprolyl isomerase [Ignavibacteria bacterium]
MLKIISRISVFFIAVTVVIIGYRCSSEKIIAEIGEDKITLSDFEEKYLKKYGYDVEIAKSKPLEDKISFLNDMINTELKARLGLEKKLDTTESFRNDLKLGEKKILSDVYIKSKLIEPGLKNYYDKIKYDLRASHILLPMEENSGIEDSVKTYSLAYEIINRLSANESFDSLARIYSTDIETRDNGGDLYYFSPGMTVSDFEFAAYNLNKGEFTKEPVRTNLGLHIIKLTDKKERYDSVRVSHILITDAVNESGIKDSTASYNKIKEILEKLNDGDEFEELASQFSNDTINKSRGGDLGYVRRRQYAAVFDSTIFSLKPGQISDIIRTEYGWHIIKMTDAVEIKPFDEIKNTLSLQYPMSVYFRKNYEEFVTEIRNKYNLTVEQSGVDFLISKIKDTTLAFIVINPNKLFSDEDRKVVTGKFDGGEITVNDLIVYVSTNKPAANKELNLFNLIGLIRASADAILQSKEAISEGFEKNENYTGLLKEYKNYLLAEAVDKYVITADIKITDEEIQNFYNENKKDFITKNNGIEQEKGLSEVKNQITDILRNSKFKDAEKLFLDNLKVKYGVKINNSILEKAFNG